MPIYVLVNIITQLAVENVRDCPERTKLVKEMVESLGGTWTECYVTMGRYIGVVIADFFDDSTAAKAVLALASSGDATTEPLQTFLLEEFHDIVDAIPLTSSGNDR